MIATLCLAACVTASAQSSVAAEVAQAPVTWLIFVDDLHLDFRNTGRIRDAIKRIVAQLVREGDSFAIASSGPSGLAIDVTTDRQLLTAAIRKTTGNGLRLSDILQGDGAAEARYRASKAVAAAQSMLNSLSRLPAGPKALLYISNGYSFDLLPDRPPGSRSLGLGFDVTRSEVSQQLTGLTATAARSAVGIFPIDPRVTFDDLDLLDDRAHRSAMSNVLQSMADGSGGLAIVGGEFGAQLTRITDAMRK